MKIKVRTLVNDPDFRKEVEKIIEAAHAERRKRKVIHSSRPRREIYDELNDVGLMQIDAMLEEIKKVGEQRSEKSARVRELVYNIAHVAYHKANGTAT